MKPKFKSRLVLGLSSIALALSASSAFGVTETFNTAGTFNWVCPGGVTSIQVECRGGGGAGGLGTGIATGTSQNGGGGGGGAYAKRVSVPVTANQPYTFTIPAAAVSAGGNGASVAGGAVTFTGDTVLGNPVIVKAAGGAGGVNIVVTTNSTGRGAGGAGGTTASSVGDAGAVFAGGAGASGTFGSQQSGDNSSGAGGGGAGNTAAGGNAVAGTGTGSTPGAGGVAGGGIGGTGAINANTTAVAGGAGGTSGGGGGGGKNVGNKTTLGGTGGLGQIVLTYTIPPNFKADNTDNLNLASSWTGGFVPTGSIAEWQSTVTGANTTSLGADLTFSGIKISNPGGPVTVNSPGGFALTLGAAAVDLDLSAATQDLTINSNLALGAANVWDVASGRTATLGGIVSGSSTVTKQGAGAVTLSGASTYSGTTTVSGGSMSVTGSLVNASLGNVVVQSGATLNASGTVTGSTTTALTFGSTAGTSTVNVSSGANLTLGALTGSNNASAVSIYNQTGGTVNLNAAATTTDTSYVSQLGYGYMNLTGGSIASNSRFSVTFSSTGPVGVARIGGGAGAASLSANDLMAIGRTGNSIGEMTVLPSGTVTYNGTGANNMLLLGNAANCTGFLNIVGGNFSSPAKGISWGNGTTTNGGLGMVSLAAGTLEIGTNLVLNTIASGNNRGYVNLAGGTLKMRSSGITTGLLPVSSGGFSGTGGLANTVFGAVTNSTLNLDGSGGASGISGTIGTTRDFVGGVTVDTNGFNSTFTSQLLAPTGNGVAQGNLNVTGGSGYVAPPTVKFSSPAAGNSTPAAGYARVSGGQVTGIVITCPGDYATGETPTVTLNGGGGTGASVTVTGTLAANTSGGLIKTGAGTLTLSSVNTYAGATTVNGGLFVLSGSGTIAATSALSVGSSAALRYLPTTIGSTLAVASLNLSNGSALTLAWNATTANLIAATGAASVGTGTGVALDMGTGYNSGTTYTILTAASGLDVGNYSFLNLTDYTMSVVKSSTAVTITPTATTALSGAYWRGTATAGLTKIWAATDGTTDSNWSATDGGATQGLVPGVTTDVIISNTTPIVPATSTVLGANMNIKSLTIADATNGLSLNADGNTLTLTPGVATSGMAMNSGVPASTIAPAVVLGADQTWTNDSSNLLSVTGGVSGGFALTKAGSGPLVLPVANGFSGGLTVKAGAVTLGTATSAGTGTLTFDNGGLGTATAQYSSGSALTVTNPVIVLTGSISSNTFANVGSNNVTLNSAIDIASSTTLSLVNNNTGTSSLELGAAASVTGGGSIVTSGTSTGNLVFRGANTYSGGTTLGGSSVHVPGSSTNGPAGSPTDGNFGTGILNIGTVSMRSTTLGDTTIGNTLSLDGDLTAINGGGSEKTLIFSGPATLTGTRTITSNLSATGKSLTFSGSIGDGGNGFGLSKAGSGTLLLSSAASTFTGPVVVSAGMLQSSGTDTLASIGTVSALGAGNATSNATNAASMVLDGGTYSVINTNAPVTTNRLFTLTQNGGTLSADNGTDVNVLTFNNTAPIAYTGSGARTLTLGGAHPGGSNANLFAPQITDAGADMVSLQKTGATNWTLTNANTYSGPTTIAAGILQLGDGTSGNDGTIANSSGVVNSGTLIFNRFGSSSAGYPISGTGAVTKLGVGTQTLGGLSGTAANNYAGTTTIDNGTLAFTTTSPSLTGGLTFGATAGSTNVGALDLNTTSATFGGGLIVRTNSANTNLVTIGAGQTLTITGSSVTNAISVGSATADSVAKLQIMGSTGTLAVTDATRNIVVANTDTIGASAAQLDLSGLGNFSATVANVYVGRPTSAAGAAASGRPVDSLTLAGGNSISATGNIVVGAQGTTGFVGSATLNLGTTNTLNASSFVVGNGRTSGTVQFNTGLSSPSVIIRGASGGSSRTSITLGDHTNSTGVGNGVGGSSSATGTMNFTGGTVDAMIDTLVVGNGAATASNLRGKGNGVFTFGTGSSVNINTLRIGQAANTVSVSSSQPQTGAGTGTFTMNGGTLQVNTAITIANDADTTATANGIQNCTGNFNQTGGDVTLGSIGTPVNVLMGNHLPAGNSGIATATMNLTGGTTTVFGNIQEGALEAGSITSSLTLNGATLDMKGNSIGASGSLVDTTTFASGTLKNVAAINGTGGLTKTTAGTLIIDGTNTYTGATVVTEGTLALANGSSPASSASMSIDAAGTLDTTAQATYAIPATQPVTISIDPAGAGTSGKIAAAGLDITNAVVTLNPIAALDDAVYVLATYSGTLTGSSFAAPLPIVPSGYTLQYAYEGNKIALVQNPGGTYASWINGFFPGETDPAIIGATADPDNDGIENAAEMVLGGDPKLGMDTALLPTIELVNADPDGDTTFSDYLLFTYRRTAISETALVTADCETDTDLVAPWTPATGAPNVVILTDTDFTFTPAAPADTDRVRVYVPRAANTTLFGRLNVRVP